MTKYFIVKPLSSIFPDDAYFNVFEFDRKHPVGSIYEWNSFYKNTPGYDVFGVHKYWIEQIRRKLDG